MDGYWKAACGVLIASVLSIVVGKKDKDLSVVLSMTVCAMVGVLALSYLDTVINLLHELEEMAQLSGALTGILLKAAAIAIVTEVAAVTCSDGGNASMGKTLQLLGGTVILWLSVPVIQSFMELLQEILLQV